MISHRNHHIFIAPIKNLWSELSNGILVDVWVQKLTPNQPISICDPAIASSISFSVSLTKFTAPSANPARRWNHTINLFMVELSVCMVSAPGVVGWWHCVMNTVSDWRQKGWIGGDYFYLLQAPFGTAVAKKHRPHAPSWSSVAEGVAQAPYWLLPLQQWQRCQCNALMMHCTLNSLITTINDN